jgi:hypothetical protein
MMDVVYVDETWFNMKQVKKTYFLAEGEADSHRTAKRLPDLDTIQHVTLPSMASLASGHSPQFFQHSAPIGTIQHSAPVKTVQLAQW